ncbi:MAG TPA: dTDP-4-dehydrorhamnose reductase [Acidimicrobiales bacterium]|nr:dTDP-4-dehydrorhamnose reductase [Acidimicrobiales bacterium]
MSRATRVLVTGGAGQVGVDLVDTLNGVSVPGADVNYWADGRRVEAGEFDVLALTRHDVDFTNEAAVAAAVAAARADVIVNLAAYTAVDRAESDAATCYAVNDLAVGALSRAAAEVGTHLITISTDYVFDGAKGAAYVEDDPTGPLNVYGASKLAGERRCSPLDTIVRTSWVMGVRGRNVLRVIAQRAESGDSVRFVNDQMGTVTVAADLARALVALVRERPGGLWHVANEGATTWFDVAAFAGRELGRGDEFATAISTRDLVPAPAATRPARADLSTQRLRAAGFLAPPPWRDALARLLAARDASW